VIDVSGGTVSVASEVGKETTFVVHLLSTRRVIRLPDRINSSR
jgi:signal transduction histidine kinase